MLTVPTMRKIRAYYRGDFCNAAVRPILKNNALLRLILDLLPGIFVLQGLNNLTALPGNKAVDPFVVGALGMRIPGLYTYKLQNTYNFLVSRILDFLLCGIAIAENYAAISTGQTVQSKIGIVIPKETPYLSLFPLPTLAQGLQCQNGAVLTILDSGCEEGESITLVPEDSMTPQIQPGICLTKDVPLFHQPLGNISGHAKKPILGRGVNIAIGTLLAGAFDDPIGNAVCQFLGAGINGVVDVSQHFQFIHDLQGFSSAFGL